MKAQYAILLAVGITIGIPSQAGTYINSCDIGNIRWSLAADCVEGSSYSNPSARPSTTSVVFNDSFSGVYTIYYNMTLTGLSLLNGTNQTSITVPSTIRWDSHGSAGVRTGPLQYIASGAFHNAHGITSVTLPANILEINLPCFRGCSDLEEINISSSRYSTQDGVLYNADKTKLIKYPEGKKDRFFVVPETVTELAPYCFANTELVAVLFQGDKPNADSTSFSGSSFLVYRPKGGSGWTGLDADETWGNLEIRDGRIGESEGAFFEYEIEDGNAIITDARTVSGDITVPSVLGGFPVVGIGDDAFWFCSDLISVTIPASVVRIGTEAFAGDSSSSLTGIEVDSGNGMFCSIDGVLFSRDKTVLVAFPGGKTGDYTIPDGVTNIADGAFSCCLNLMSVTVPKGVTSIGDHVFYDCEGLTSVNLPEGVITIGFEAFSSCYELASVTLPSSVTSIGWYAFENCYELISIRLPDGVESIGVGAFRGCFSLSSIVIPDGVSSIEYGTFEWCTGLTTIRIPASVTSIGDQVFFNCDSLATLTLPRSFSGTTDEMGIPDGCKVVFVDSVRLDPQGGSGGTENVSATFGLALPSITVPTRVGYAFGGYYTSPGGGGTQYYTASGLSARTWDRTSSTTLYAKWTQRVSLSPVYRFYSPKTKGHFFTINEAEKNDLIAKSSHVWNYEGIAYYAYKQPVAGTVPLYRFYAPGAKGHFYTRNEGEKNNLIITASRTWNYEGIAYYVAAAATTGTTPVYRFWAAGAKHHFYTRNEGEKNNLIATASRIWNYEGIAFHAWSGATASYANCPVAGGIDPDNEMSGAITIAVPNRSGLFEADRFLLETRFDAPTAVELAEAADAAPAESEMRAVRVALPEGASGITLWDSAKGAEETLPPDEDDTVEFDLPASGVWYWLRLSDGETANPSFMLWLRLIP